MNKAALLATLRSASGLADLEYDLDPEPLTGGYYAEMARFRLADPSGPLTGDLVARLVPNPVFGRWEATVQGAVARQGFPTPTVRLTAPESGPLGRYLVVMDHVAGRPPLEGLGAGQVLGDLPTLLRGLPDQLARVAAALHALDPSVLEAERAALDTDLPTTVEAFLVRQSDHAAGFGAVGLVSAADQLLRDAPPSPVRVITHGDLHPFNLLVGAGEPVLVDWTLSLVAHPAFTVSFAELMLAHPPLALPRAARVALAPVARSMARRFLRTYHLAARGTAGAITASELRWHRRVHALRILVEIAGWDAAGARPSDHPWLVVEPVARRTLGVG